MLLSMIQLGTSYAWGQLFLLTHSMRVGRNLDRQIFSLEIYHFFDTERPFVGS